MGGSIWRYFINIPISNIDQSLSFYVSDHSKCSYHVELHLNHWPAPALLEWRQEMYILRFSVTKIQNKTIDSKEFLYIYKFIYVATIHSSMCIPSSFTSTLIYKKAVLHRPQFNLKKCQYTHVTCTRTCIDVYYTRNKQRHVISKRNITCLLVRNRCKSWKDGWTELTCKWRRSK